MDSIRHSLAALSTPTSSSSRRPVPTTHECFFHTNLSCNASASDAVDIYGCATTDNNGLPVNYFNAHKVFINSGTNITLTLSFPGHAMLLALFDNDVNLLRSSSAAIGGSASITYSVTTSAYYLVTVEPMEFLATGSYTLSLTCNSTPQPGLCTTSATTMCLSGDRYAVSATWRTPDGNSGQGQVGRVTSDTGYFTFFNASNVEAVIKVLNGCSVNSRYWVFGGGLTNVNVVLTVRDTKTGVVKTYVNPLNTAFQPIQDTNAFATCP